MAKRKKEGADPVTSVRLFLDTCVWLDLAGNEANAPLLGALEALCRQDVIEVVVPQIVRDEFANNKDRIIKESGRSLRFEASEGSDVEVWKPEEKKERG
jgi:hypothetical protein